MNMKRNVYSLPDLTPDQSLPESAAILLTAFSCSMNASISADLKFTASWSLF